MTDQGTMNLETLTDQEIAAQIKAVRESLEVLKHNADNVELVEPLQKSLEALQAEQNRRSGVVVEGTSDDEDKKSRYIMYGILAVIAVVVALCLSGVI